MYLPGTSKEYILIPPSGPKGVDLTQYTAEIALVADDGSEPADTDYHPATWLGGEAALLEGPGGTVDYPNGEYMAWLRITAGAERPVIPAGRIRVGDTRG